MKKLNLNDTLKEKWREIGFDDFAIIANSLYILNNSTHSRIKMTPHRTRIKTDMMNVESDSDIERMIQETKTYFLQQWSP